MNLKVAYVPFAGDPVMVQMAETVVTNHNSVHKADRFRPGILVRGDSLKDISWFQQLYIFAHGTEGSGYVYDCNHGKQSMAQVAKQLRDQKLTTLISKVKLWICSGGAGGERSGARQLKDAMVAAGFSRVSVYGYTKTLDAGLVDGHKWGSDYDPDTKVDSNIEYAKNIRVKF